MGVGGWEGSSVEHVDERMCSVYDADIVANDLRYSLPKNEENKVF